MSSDEEAYPLIAPNRYLLYLACENVRTHSPKTLRTYAEALYDYFSFLEANSLTWDSWHDEILNLSPLMLYRNWSLESVNTGSRRRQLSNSTVNTRLAALKGFYSWAKREELIANLPWKETEVAVSRLMGPRFAKSFSTTAKSDNLLLPQFRKPPKILNLAQVKELISACNSPTFNLMTKLMLGTGLRNEECRTFPRRYIVDPTGFTQEQRIPIELNPADMRIKGNKPRRIYISCKLMAELKNYLLFGENVVRTKLFNRANSGQEPIELFLNRWGEPFSERALNLAYRYLWAGRERSPPVLNFKVTPHLLQHTFATHELHAENQKRDLISALSWVRDRLGHSSLQTTTIYIHCLDQLAQTAMNAYQEELDRLLKDVAADAL